MGYRCGRHDNARTSQGYSFILAMGYRCGRHDNARKGIAMVLWKTFRILAMGYRCGRHDNARTSQGYSFILAMGYRCGRHGNAMGYRGHRKGILLY